MVELRDLELKDTAELYALIEISRKDLLNLWWAESATFESTAQFIENARRSSNHVKAIVVDGQIAGCISLIDMPDGSFQLGYWLGTPHRGKRHIQHAVEKIKTLAEAYRRQIIVRIKSKNVKSLSVVKGAGFTHVGNDGEWTWHVWRP